MKDLKPRLVFLPGMLCDSQIWQFQADALSEAYDVRISDLRTQETLDEMLDEVERQIGESGILFGFSMGGYVAQQFAIQYPERLIALALLGISGDGCTESERVTHELGRKVAQAGEFKGLSEKRLRQYLHPNSYAKPEIREAVNQMVGPDPARTYLNQLSATLERPDLRKELGRLDLPVLVVGGREDRIVPEERVESLAAAFKNVELKWVEESGHFMTLEQPGVTLAILQEFLRGLNF